MKRTYQPNNRKKAKKHGFFSRIKGNVLKSRRAKKRKKLNKIEKNRKYTENDGLSKNMEN